MERPDRTERGFGPSSGLGDIEIEVVRSKLDDLCSYILGIEDLATADRVAKVTDWMLKDTIAQVSAIRGQAVQRQKAHNWTNTMIARYLNTSKSRIDQLAKKPAPRPIQVPPDDVDAD